MVISKERFSKAALAKYIAGRLGKEMRFNPSDGWNQVKNHGEEANRAYGEFRTLLDLVEEFELDLYPEPKPVHKPRPIKGSDQTEGYMKAIRGSRNR